MNDDKLLGLRQTGLNFTDILHHLDSLGFCALHAADAQDAAGPFLPLDCGGEQQGAPAAAGDRAREDEGGRNK